MKYIALFSVLSVLCACSTNAYSVEFRSAFSEFAITFPKDPETRSEKQQLSDTGILVDTIIVECMGDDEFLKVEIMPVIDPTYLVDVTEEQAVAMLINYAKQYGINGASFSAHKTNGIWIAESKGKKFLPLGAQKLDSIYKMKVYYGAKSIVIQHAITGVNNYPTKAILNFLEVKVK